MASSHHSHFLLCTGVVPLLLMIHCKLVVGKALPVNTPSPMCENMNLCKPNVVEQTRKLVVLLNATAPDLFSIYVSSRWSLSSA